MGTNYYWNDEDGKVPQSDSMYIHIGKRSYKFTWTLKRHHLKLTKLAKFKPDEKCVINEYRTLFTAKEFLEEIKDCNIHDYDASDWC